MDYDEIFALVARYNTINLIIALDASQGWSLHQMDVNTAFLHGSLKEEVYLEQLEGFEVQDRRTHVCRLKKAPRAWYERIDNYLRTLGLTRSEADANLHLKVENDIPLILVLYVDDLFFNRCKPSYLSMQEGVGFRVRDEGPRTDALLPRLGGLAKDK